MKKIILLWILLFTFQVFAQQKSLAVKFDEFSDFPAEYVSPFYDRVKRFGEKIKHESTDKKAVIIFYNQRKGQFPLSGGTDWAKQAADQISNYPNEIDREKIILLDGGYREYATLELWIVPKSAELPTPTPTFKKEDVVYCPEINVAGDKFVQDGGQPINFSVVVKGAAENRQFPLEWSVSAGKIIEGQGTNQIKVDLSETNKKIVTAAVIVKTLPPECNCHAYNSTEIGLHPNKVDEFGYILYSDLSARMDGYFIQLNNDPSASGYVVIYASRAGGKKDAAKVIRNIKMAVRFRRYDESRVKVVDGGFREEMTVEFYLVPAGVEPPKPTPTLNSDFVIEPPARPKKRRRNSK